MDLSYDRPLQEFAYEGQIGKYVGFIPYIALDAWCDNNNITYKTDFIRLVREWEKANVEYNIAQLKANMQQQASQQKRGIRK
jgi:hypothetical protein